MEIHWRLLLTSFLYIIFGVASYFQSGVYNLLDDEVKSFINASIYRNYHKSIAIYQLEWLYSILTAILFVGWASSGLFMGYLMEKFGRKGSTVFLKNAIVIIASLLSFFAVYWDRFELLFLGRVLNGLAMPIAMFDTIYLSECAPSSSRAFVALLPSIGMRCMIVFGITMGLPVFFGNADRWHFLFFIPILFSTIYFVIGAFLPESPRYLYITLNDEEKARKSLQFYQGEEADIDQIIAQYEQEKEAIAMQESAGLVKIFKTKHLRWPLLICTCLYLTPTLDGLDIVNMFSTTTLSLVTSPNKAALYSILFIQLPTLIAMIIGLVLIANKGRRPVLFFGYAIAIIGTVLVASSSIKSSDFLAIIGLGLIPVGHSIGPTLVRQFVAAELCPQISRTKTVSLGILLEAIASIIVLSLYTPTTHRFGNGIMTFCTISSCLCFVFLFKYFPETRNKTVMENISRWLPQNENVDESTPLVMC